MFITEEILSGVHMCGLQLCFSFPQGQSGPALLCFQCVFVLYTEGGSFSTQLLSERLRLLVQITLCSLSPVLHRSFHPAAFSCRLRTRFTGSLETIWSLRLTFVLSLGSIEHAVFVSPLFFQITELFVCAAVAVWSLKRQMVLFWWKLMKCFQSQAPYVMSIRLNSQCVYLENKLKVLLY